MIKNTCAECGKEIEIAIPLDEDEDFKGEIDHLRVKVLTESTTSVCHTCEPLSSWRRSSMSEPVFQFRYDVFYKIPIQGGMTRVTVDAPDEETAKKLAEEKFLASELGGVVSWHILDRIELRQPTKLDKLTLHFSDGDRTTMSREEFIDWLKAWDVMLSTGMDWESIVSQCEKVRFHE